MKRIVSMIVSMALLLSFLPQYTVRAEEPETSVNWDGITSDSSDAEKEAALAEAKRLVSVKEATLVTAEDWTTGGAYKDGSNYVPSTRYWTDQGSVITMSTENVDGSDVVKITSNGTGGSAAGGQANFKMLADTVTGGDKLFYAFRIKAVSKDGSTDSGVVTTAVRVRPDTGKTGSGEDIRFDLECTVGEDWKLVCGVGSPSVGTPAGSDDLTVKTFGAVIFQNGDQNEEFMIKDLCVVNLSKKGTTGEIPDEKPDDTPTLTPADESTLQAALERVEAGYATLLSEENWTTIGSAKGDIIWTTAGGSIDANQLTVTEEEVEGQSFTKAVKVAVTGTSTSVNDAQVGFRLKGLNDTEDGSYPVEVGDEIFCAFRIKGTLADSSKIIMRPDPNDFNNNTDMRAALGNPIVSNVGDWTLIAGTGIARYSSGNYGSILFQLGLAQQEFEIADFYVINMSRGENTAGGDDAAAFTYDEIQEKIQNGEGTLVTYPNLSAQGAYSVEYQDNLNENNFTVTLLNDAAGDITEALNVKSTELGQNAWSGQVYFNLDQTKKINAGDVLFFECKVRGISTVTNKEAMFISANTRVRPDRSTSANFDFTSFINSGDANAWDTVYGAVIAPAASATGDGTYDETGFKTGDGAWVFQLSSAIQEFDIADVKVYNFGTAYSINQMPVMKKTYAGMEEDAQWRKDALARIEEIRKEDVSVKIVDSEGNPVEAADVWVDMTRHEFGFGSIVNVDSYNTWDAATQAAYKEAFNKIAHNRAGFENAMKHYYITDETRQGLIDEWMTYFAENGKDIRGHVLIYGDDSRLRSVNMSGASTDMPEKELFTSGTEEGNAALKAWTLNHIRTYVNKYKGSIYNWDVVNENIPSHLPSASTGNMFWSDRLDGYDTLVEWFKAAHEADPDARLTYNDYAVLANEGTRRQYIELCEYLIDNDAPITTLGVQGHIGVMSPETIINSLNQLSELGKEIEITEFTCNESDEELQAQFTRDFMIAVFSVENVTGITTWGFWENAIYEKNCEMVRKNFQLKPNGEVWLDMIYNQWWTKESGATGADGAYHTRAFKGEHIVTVDVDGVRQTFDVTVGDEPVVLNLVYADGKIEEGVVEGHEHSYTGAWKYDTDNHWKQCDGCEEIAELAAHSFGKWIVDVAATSTKEGSRHRECSVCGYKQVETIPKTEGDGGNTGDGGNISDKPTQEGDLTCVDGKYYFYEDGVMASSKEAFVNGAWRWFDEDGTMAVDKDVYLYSNGGKWARYDENGEMVRGEDYRYDGWYYFEPVTGAMMKGAVVLEDGRKVFYDTVTGQMLKGEHVINGETYVFDEIDGHLISGTETFFWVHADGKDYWYEDWVKQGWNPADDSYRGKEIYDPASDAWYWLDNVAQGGKAVGKDVYQESWSAYPDRGDGTGKWVRYDENGHMVKGWQATDAGTYYFEQITGAMAKGTVMIDGAEYCFDVITGIMQ